MIALLTPENRGRMVPSEGGFLHCPYCGNPKLLRIAPGTEAMRLPVWCRKCRRELVIDIRRGQSYLSQSPDEP